MIHWGIIGCGGIARRRMIPAMVECELSTLAAVMDVDAGAVRDIAAQTGARGYLHEAELLADPTVQAVYIATPVHMHHAQVLQAARAGKHVLVEKPMALSLDEAQEMIDACQSAGIYLAEGYMMKHHAVHGQAREMIHRGELGQVVFARSQLSCWYPEIPGAWRQQPALSGGGSLIDMASHCYDLLEYLLDAEIVEVFAYTDTLAFSYAVEDSATTLLKFTNGAHAVVDAFFNIPDAASRGRLEIYGTQGSLLGEGTIGQLPTGQLTACLNRQVAGYEAEQNRADAGSVTFDMPYTPVNMYARELDTLSRCILDRQPPTLNTGEHGLHLLRVVQAAYESSKTKRAVAVAPSRAQLA